MKLLPSLLCSALVLAPPAMPRADDAKQPNVALIVCDDLNDFVGHLGGHPQARTPHMDALAQSGVPFRRAYCQDPICAPSRASFFTGLHPFRSGDFTFRPWFEFPVLQNPRTLMEHFRADGCRVVGSGKLMHHHRESDRDEFPYKADYGPFACDGKDRVGHPSVPEPFRSIGPGDGSFAPLEDVPFGGKDGMGWIYGAWSKTVQHLYRLWAGLPIQPSRGLAHAAPGWLLARCVAATPPLTRLKQERDSTAV